MSALKDRTVIITGAAQGIGAAYALEIAQRGANVVVSDILECEDTVAAIKKKGGTALGLRCDVTDERSINDMMSKTLSTFGAIHGLVNNAALFTTLPKQRFEQISAADFDRVMVVNVRGSFECMKAVTPHMRKQKYGKIVNIASGTVFKGAPMMLSYVTSKGAIIAMTRCAARELGSDGIRVNCLAPGLTMSEGVKSDSTWTGRMESTVASRCLTREETPEDLIGSVCFLLSQDSDFMTGQTIVVDGGAAMH